MNVLLVGGNSGIGEATLKLLQIAEHKVTCLYRSHPNEARQLDLATSAHAIREVVKDAVDSTFWGHLDALVVTAGMGAYYWPTVDPQEVDKLFRANVLGPMAVYRASLRYLLKSHGKVCFVTSTAARRPGAGGLSYYAAAKGALHSFVISESRRLAKHGVGMYAIAPGWVETRMTENLAPALRAKLTKSIPAGEFGSPYSIAAIVRDTLDWPNWSVAGQIYEASGGA